MDVFKAVLVDVSVNLGRGDVGMTEHKLDGAQICSVCKQVGGEGMAQHVR